MQKNLVSCSADKTILYWDAQTGTKLKKYLQRSFINSCLFAKNRSMLIASGSDDGQIHVYDVREKNPVHTFANKYPIISVAFSKDADSIFGAGIENEIRNWNFKAGKEDPDLKLQGHTDSITGIKLSHDGKYILSNSMDNTVRIFDAQPYCPEDRNVKIFTGAQHNFEKSMLRCSWSPDDKKVASGSCDHNMYIWNVDSRRLLYKLPGHSGSVNDVDFHPTEPIIVSASTDGTLLIGEI